MNALVIKKNFLRWIASLLMLGSGVIFCACNQQPDFVQATVTPSVAVSNSPVVQKTKTVPGDFLTQVILTPTPTAIPALTESVMEEKIVPTTAQLKITIVYDNRIFDRRLKSAWGFSALVEYLDHWLLFDTGGDGSLLINNMDILGIDPTLIESLVLSHAHDDHTGGLSALLASGSRPVIYLPPSFSNAFKQRVSNITEVIEVSPGLMIAQNIFTTGELGGSIPEQALVIDTDQGLMIITGCAHPGIVEMIEQSRLMFNDRVRLVMGGFHLGGKSESEIEEILKDFRRLGVEQVAPCHCTGEEAIAAFATEYGEDFIQVGVGKQIFLDPEND